MALDRSLAWSPRKTAVRGGEVNPPRPAARPRPTLHSQELEAYHLRPRLQTKDAGRIAPKYEASWGRLRSE
jgi:hypothetical protein